VRGGTLDRVADDVSAYSLSGYGPIRRSTVNYDVSAVRRHFPALDSGAAFFDGPGGTQTPRAVGDAIAATLCGPLSNRGSSNEAERNASDSVARFRLALAELLGADPRGIVYGRSATQLTYDMSRALAKTWSPDDEVVVTRLDHDSNIRPWVRAAERAGAVTRWVDFDPATGELSLDSLRAVLGPRCRLVAVTAASNLIGTRPPVAAIARLVHDAGALLYVDGVHYTAHQLVDVAALGADFFTCSPYKFLGPHCGVLAADPALLADLVPDKLLASTMDVPERFELGTLPYELMAGSAAAVDFLATLGARRDGTRRQRLAAAFAAIDRHESALRAEIEAGLAEIGGITIYSRAASRTPTLLIDFADRQASEVSRHLSAVGVNAPSGSFYALEASRHLGLGDDGALRIGLAPYTDRSDVERLLDGIASAVGSGTDAVLERRTS
jgi:cysteine desulfurase family protein (TIGR01976 family)